MKAPAGRSHPSLLATALGAALLAALPACGAHRSQTAPRARMGATDSRYFESSTSALRPALRDAVGLDARAAAPGARALQGDTMRVASAKVGDLVMRDLECTTSGGGLGLFAVVFAMGSVRDAIAACAASDSSVSWTSAAGHVTAVAATGVADDEARCLEAAIRTISTAPDAECRAIIGVTRRVDSASIGL